MREMQIGSVKTFFVIGVVLACILVGSIFYLKNRGESVLIAQKETTSQESKSDKDASKDKTSEKPAVSTQEEADSSNEVVAVSDDLPTTGPESTISEAILLFIATFLISSFIQSKILKPAGLVEK